jgi:hypothetical protein
MVKVRNLREDRNQSLMCNLSWVLAIWLYIYIDIVGDPENLENRIKYNITLFIYFSNYIFLIMKILATLLQYWRMEDTISLLSNITSMLLFYFWIIVGNELVMALSKGDIFAITDEVTEKTVKLVEDYPIRDKVLAVIFTIRRMIMISRHEDELKYEDIVTNIYVMNR